MADFVAHVALGEGRTSVGHLRFTHAGPRQFSTFTYGAEWIENPRVSAYSPISLLRVTAMTGGPGF